MWAVNGKTLIQLQGDDGGPFASLMNSLILCEALSLGIPIASIKLTRRTNLGDGGVDGVVEQSGTNDKTGWFGVPTVWQFKGTAYVNISDAELKNEINKYYATELIKKGYGYRFCICDDPPAPKVADWEKILNEEAIKIDPAAKPAMVLHTSRLAAWVEKYPALCIQYFEPGLAEIQTLTVWGTTAKDATQKYINVPEWKGLFDEIKSHANFLLKPSEAVVAVLGASGVGKTRLVYEALSSIPEAESLVIYTRDEQKAIQIASTLLSRPGKRALIVADECSLTNRVRLQETLRSARERVRVVAIDNTATRGSSTSPWLRAIPIPVVLEILEANFPTVASDQRASYAHLSSGFIRIAADMCRYHDKIVQAQNFGPIAQGLEDYLGVRLSEEQQLILQAVAMLKRLGTRDDVREELELLCSFFGLDPLMMDHVAMQMKDAPGFIEHAGRYIAVTPEPIAQVAFHAGYRRWISPDPITRLNKFPPQLLDSFCKRVSDHGTEEVRREVGEAFRSEIIRYTGDDLANSLKVKRLVTLVETDPEVFIPILRKVIDESTDEQLSKNTGVYVERWGPRRDLVWLSERMASFAEFFVAAEAILWRLSQVETEPNIGNNSTSQWRQLFWVDLSGTPVPFGERIKLLEQRASVSDPDLAKIAFGAFNDIFSRSVFRSAAKQVFAGRISPYEWHPTNEQEYAACIHETIQMLARLILLGPAWRATLAVEMIDEHLWLFILEGHAHTIYSIYANLERSPEQQSKLRVHLEDLIHNDNRGIGKKLLGDSKQFLQQWILELSPKDIVTRIISAITIDTWHYAGKDRVAEQKQWEENLDAISNEVVANPQVFPLISEILYSPESRSAGVFALSLGKLDRNLTFLPQILGTATERKSSVIVRWYLAGLLEAYPDQIPALNDAVNVLETSSPIVAYETILTLGKPIDSFNRVLKMVDDGRIGAEYLKGFIYGNALSDLTSDQFKTMLNRLFPRPEREPRPTIDAAINLLHMKLQRKEAAKEFLESLQSQDVDVVFGILEASIELKGMNYEWGRVLSEMAAVDLPRAASLAALGLVKNRSGDRERETVKVVKELGSKEPVVMMSAIGTQMLDRKNGMWFHVGNYREVFESLPAQVVKNWVENIGIDGARKIARHLPKPVIDQNDAPIVPELTEYVLTQFGDDDRTFREFCMGIHSFEVYFAQDLSMLHEAEAKVAERFLNHPISRIREWAEIERKSALQNAAEEARQNEEESIE